MKDDATPDAKFKVKKKKTNQLIPLNKALIIEYILTISILDVRGMVLNL